MKKLKFHIKGMHCNACSQNIEEELRDKVKSISVSYADEKAVIEFDESKISEKEIIATIKKLGYEAEVNAKPEEKKKTFNSDTLGWIVVVAAVLVFAYLVYHFSGFKIPEIGLPQAGDNIGLVLLFLIGLLTGFHCVSMCGAFIVSYTAKNAINGHKSYKQHLVYGGSKVLSYTIIGGIFGLIGGIFTFSILLRGTISILAGGFMIFFALGLMGLKFFRKFSWNPKFLGKLNSKTPKGPYATPFFTGILNGLFIACGPLQAMYLYAAGTGSWIAGASGLFAFGLGTLPVMLGFGIFATKISHETTAKILKISAIIVLILGLIMINRGLSLTGSPLSYDAIKSKFVGQPVITDANNPVITNGVQEINMNVDASGYSPSSFVLKKGVPVKWNVNVKELTGCNQELVLRDYGIDKNLKAGMNVIEFTPDKLGTLSFTCGMGMLHGSFIVTDTGTATPAQVSASAASGVSASGGSCSMGSGGGSCGCSM